MTPLKPAVLRAAAVGRPPEQSAYWAMSDHRNYGVAVVRKQGVIVGPLEPRIPVVSPAGTPTVPYPHTALGGVQPDQAHLMPAGYLRAEVDDDLIVRVHLEHRLIPRDAR